MPNVGFKHSEETKLKMGISRKDRTHSLETINKIRLKNSGKKRSEESRKRLSEGAKRRFESKEERIKIGNINRGKSPSEETRRKISMALKGKIHPPRSEESKRKQGESRKGFKHTPESIIKMRLAHIGDRPTKEAIEKARVHNLGRIVSEETRKRMSEAQKKSKKHPKGYKLSEERCRKMSEERTGKKQPWSAKEKHWNWRGGITPLNQKIKTSYKYSEWRTGVFIRDSFTCKKCGQKGGKLEAHHIKPFSLLIEEAKNCMPLFNIYDACMVYVPMWDIENGQTLCRDCHKQLKHKGGKL